MSFIDAYHEKNKEIVHVAERLPDGTRKLVQYPAEYRFYYPEANGKYLSENDDPLAMISVGTKTEFDREIKTFDGRTLWEKDISPLQRILQEKYKNCDLPNLHIAGIDIETDFNPKKGFSSIDDPFSEITAITIHQSWTGKLITFVVPPKTIDINKADEICNRFPDTYRCLTEREMLRRTIDALDDADIISGWNSQGFDIPYIVQRIEMVLGRGESRRLCLWGQLPRRREFEMYGKTQFTYELTGRVSLDYMDLYKKYTYHELPSYSLQNVAMTELGEGKIDYDGTLDHLYNYDFDKFILYNRKDTLLIHQFEKKLKYIGLINGLVHDIRVSFQNMLGTVIPTDQALVNLSHEEEGRIVRSKKYSKEFKIPDGFKREYLDHNNVEEVLKQILSVNAGAYVADPNAGINKWVFSVDVTSLYPSIIRALNMSPETVFGQLNQIETINEIAHLMLEKKMGFADAWNGKFGSLEYEKMVAANPKEFVCIDFEDGNTQILPTQEAKTLLLLGGNPVCVSANGTIFRTDKPGLLAKLITKWFYERKQFQEKYKLYSSIVYGTRVKNLQTLEILNSTDFNNTDITPEFNAKDLEKLLNENDIDKIISFMSLNNLKIENGVILPFKIEYYESQVAFYDQRQMAKKIQLNAAYGGIANSGSRFFDQRIAQSITLTGRCIAKHMAAFANEMFTGKYEHTGGIVSYGDTDSQKSTTIIRTSEGNLTVEDLFENCSEIEIIGEKEYAYDSFLEVLSYDPELQTEFFGKIDYIYRHKVSKESWEIEDENSNIVTITCDHSVMIERNGILMEIKPKDINIETDLLVTIIDNDND